MKERLCEKDLRSLIVIPQYHNLKHWKDDKTTISSIFVNLRIKFFFRKRKDWFLFQVFIPADGMVEFQHNLGELIDQYDNGKSITDDRMNWLILIDWVTYFFNDCDWFIVIDFN